ncbi:hypothetical protein R3P38DRAFT_2766032 [Favolaschia claudopus]|uniref:Zn(2)-C6 fungal-type domain-containing protein n=1 Tax=Favolaschia claudopus TaxID=2862362 RepID=A0AAW0CYC1_9AGAR
MTHRMNGVLTDPLGELISKRGCKDVECMTNDMEQNPCERCVEKGLQCEYVLVADERNRPDGPPSPTSNFNPSSNHNSALGPGPRLQAGAGNYWPGYPAAQPTQQTYMYPGTGAPVPLQPPPGAFQFGGAPNHSPFMGGQQHVQTQQHAPGYASYRSSTPGHSSRSSESYTDDSCRDSENG